MKKKILILGGDGYLGWSLGLAFAKRTDSNIVLADNLIKNRWEKEVKAKSLVPLKCPDERIAEYTRIFGKSNLSFEKLDILEYDSVVKMIRKHKPEVIINAAQQPSAPFSMMSAKNSAITFNNNVIGNLNMLWAIAEVDKNITYVKLGSLGCYSGIDSNYIPLEKVDFKFNHKNKQCEILNSWCPMYATDFYHQSKIDDFLIDELASNVWELKVVTVQQSTIFGATIEENCSLENSALSTRFNYDSVFGTIVNRFVCQYHLGGPLTIYGDGNQKTGIISLKDTIDNFLKVAQMDIQPGKHKIVHNYTACLSINEIAEVFKEIDGKVPIININNPRKEVKTIFKKEFEIDESINKQQINKFKYLKEEIENLIGFVARYKSNIDPSLIIPKVLWEKKSKILRKRKFSLTSPQ